MIAAIKAEAPIKPLRSIAAQIKAMTKPPTITKAADDYKAASSELVDGVALSAKLSVTAQDPDGQNLTYT